MSIAFFIFCTEEECLVLENIPDREELAALLGPALYEVWAGLCAAIDAKYEM